MYIQFPTCVSGFYLGILVWDVWEEAQVKVYRLGGGGEEKILTFRSPEKPFREQLFLNYKGTN